MYNKRTDEYGGSPLNRARLALEILADTKSTCGDDYPVWIKLNCADFEVDDKGLVFEDFLIIAKALANNKIDAIEVSGGTFTGKYTPVRSKKHESYHLDYAKKLADETDVPIILVGGNRKIETIEKILAETKIEAISMCRPLIREPGLVKRWSLGDTKEATCLACNGCFNPEGTTCFQDLTGEAKKRQQKNLKKITVRNDSPISILMSPKTGKLTYAVKPASLSQTDFERQYPFDKKVKAFLGFPIVNFLNYHEGEISIIAYNKKQGIATYDRLLMETLVNTARIVSYLMDLAISNNRILNDLETAHETQSQLLPKNDPQIPGLDIAGESIYCDETGGDYYDYFCSKDETGNAFSAVIADVSGHGISAALIMMAARALLKSLVPQTDHPSQIITDLNRLLCQDTLESGNFMTMLFFMIDPVDKSITWVRAGHEPIVCYNPALNQFTELKGSGIAIGLDDEYRYEEFTRDSLADDQIFLVVTDGIWEARNEKGQMLGKDPVKDVIRKHSLESSKVIKDAVIAVVREFIGSAPLEDDLTIIIVKLTCTPQANSQLSTTTISPQSSFFIAACRLSLQICNG
jgi:serine phosphatase RsbU (regulator of sigma subunit)